MGGQPLVRVGIVRKTGPVVGMETRRIPRQRRTRFHGLIAGKDSAPQKAVATGVSGELEIAIQIAIADSLCKCVGMSSRSAILTTRRTFTRGVSRKRTEVTTPKSP